MNDLFSHKTVIYAILLYIISNSQRTNKLKWINMNMQINEVPENNKWRGNNSGELRTPSTCSAWLNQGTQMQYTFDVHTAVHRNIISIVKPTRPTTVSNLFYFGMTLYMFRTVFPSIIRSSRLFIPQPNRYVWQMPVAVCTVLNSWWWTERPSETCRVSFQNKINLIHWYT